MKSTYRSIGFVASALVHLAGVAAFLPQLSGVDRSTEAEPRVAVSLAMFQPVVPPAPVEPDPPVVSEPPVAPPRTEPEPVSIQPTTEPRPEVPPVEPEPRPVARPVAKPATRPKPPRKPRSNPPPSPPRITKSPGPRPPPVVEAIEPDSRVAARALPVSAVRPVGEPSVPAASSVKDRYLSALVKRIHEKKYYPRRARRRREEGTVLVAFVIDASGRLTDLHVTRSSGHDSLDKAALKTLKKISPFHALPAELGVTRWELAVPISFSLRP